MENNSTVKYIIYCTTNIINKKIYIGWHKTTKPYEFDGYLGDGCWSSRPSTYERSKYKFHLAVKKYGPKNFVRKTLAVFDTEEEALIMEGDIVNEEFLKRPDVYNMALGGIVGGSYLTLITIYQYSSDGTFIAEYKSIMDAARSVNRAHSSIWKAAKGKFKCANCFWTYEKYNKLDLSKMKSYEGVNTIPVFQYSDTGEYECCYNSIKEAGRILNIHDANLSRAMKLGSICNGKYFSSIYEDQFSNAKSKQITSSKIYQYSLDGDFIAEYKNMQEAKNTLGIKSNIYEAIKLGNAVGGYQWRFEKFKNIGKAQKKSGRVRKVGKYDKNWNLIEEYISLAECKRQNGSGMYHVLTGRDQFHKGFRYKYLD